MAGRAPLLRSLRTRLALWHAGTLGLVLIIFAAATWAYLERITQERVDQSLADAVRSFYQAVLAEVQEGTPPEDAAAKAAREFRFSERRVLVYGSGHRLIAVSDSANDVLTRAISAIEDADDSPIHPLFASLIPGSSAYAMVGDAGEPIRSYARSVPVAGEYLTIVALQLGLSERLIVATFWQAALVAIPLALLVAGVGGYLLARRSFDPVVTMGREVAAIDSEHLAARVRVRGSGDEMDELAAVFNDMLARLERSFVQQRQFMADASHELRTPVASLRAAADIALSQPRSAAEYTAALRHVRDEARHLSDTVADVFTLARLDDEEHVLHREEFFLEEIVMRSVSAIYPLAQERGQRLQFTPSREARCEGEPLLIERLVSNLLDNAIKYTPAGGEVRVELDGEPGWHIVRVGNEGEGIPPEAQAHIFDRFYRADAARTRSGSRPGGAGLGLAIAWKIARAHGGSLELTASDGLATVLTFRLPAHHRPVTVVNPVSR